MWLKYLKIVLTDKLFATKFTDLLSLSEALMYKCFVLVTEVATLPVDGWLIRSHHVER